MGEAEALRPGVLAHGIWTAVVGNSVHVHVCAYVLFKLGFWGPVQTYKIRLQEGGPGICLLSGRRGESQEVRDPLPMGEATSQGQEGRLSGL